MTEIILGPPGTGKTTELLRLVDEELTRGVPPDRIGYVSFTRRAADEAVSRACAKFKLERKALPYFRTLHSLCFQRLGFRSSEVIDGPRLDEFARYAGIRLSGGWSEDGSLYGFETGDRAVFIENMARVRMLPLRKQYDMMDEPGVGWEEVERVAKKLDAFKDDRCYVDYTDMLSKFVVSDVAPKLEVLFVDEAQDLSALQWAVVDKLRAGCRRVVVAGDDDQAIYHWAGADSARLVTLEGEDRVLGQSWRVPGAVQELALKMIGGVKKRRRKQWYAREGSRGSVERAYSLDDVDFGGRDVLVLARNTFVLQPVERELRTQGVVYERNGWPSIKARYLEAAVHWEQLRKGQKITAAQVKQIYDLMNAGQGYARGNKLLPGVDDEKLLSEEDLRVYHGLKAEGPWFEVLHKIPMQEIDYMKAARRHGEQLSKPRVRVQTIHTAKGGEAEHVVLMTEIGRRTDRECELRPDDERRVWYVGLTRAKEKLTIVSDYNPDRMRTYACPWL